MNPDSQSTPFHLLLPLAPNMNALSEIKSRFSTVLAELADDPGDLLGMIRPASDPKFGDYQANCAMPLGRQLGKAPREVATELIGNVSL